jgi:outer membrane protein assembly factor BamB
VRAFVGVSLLLLVLLAGCKHGDRAATTQAVSTGSSTGTGTASPPPAADWTQFGFDAARTNVGPLDTGITAANVGRLARQRVELPGTVDSSPIYLANVRVDGGRHDTFVVTTTYGRTLALDADSGRTLWEFVPPGIEGWEGTSQITNATPVADRRRGVVYAVSPDGRVHKLALSDGHEAAEGGWPVAVTLDAGHEKIAPALNLARGLVLAATGGYIGDAPPYQGHVVALDADTGRIVNAFNTLCSDREGLLDPPSCPESGSAIWARSGVVVEPSTGNLLVTTGNAAWNGQTSWGDSVLELSPDASRLLGSFTPENQAELEAGDVDLGSTAPAVLDDHLVVQGGKDGVLRVLDLRRMRAELGRTGGEIQTIDTPGGEAVFSAAAVLRVGGRPWVFVANSSGTRAYTLGGERLNVAWENDSPGTSPVVAGGLLYVYDHEHGRLNVYRPQSSNPLAHLEAGAGHWNSPIVVDGRIALPEGNANEHETNGVLDIYR